ncbi:hypothetical protein, partial [Poseidonibacter sp.]|uniref:hypothetical protein n=1 Tax=Poseidonibacter sp. TaxID=2321188 RepID=UPI003C76B07F
MNFYTLTFKKKILLTMGIIALLIVIIDVLLLYIADKKTTKTNYISDKFSKIKHFELNNQINKDMIFIGSSRTFYHISTNIFKNKNINIYNFGVSGLAIEDYSAIVEEIINKSPKKVVISLSVDKLYSELSIPYLPTKNELGIYYDIDKILFLNAMKQYIIQLHTFLQYSEAIYNKLQSIYERFQPLSINIPNEKIEKNENYLKIDTSLNYSKLVGCKVFDIQRTHDKQITLKCENGDGILIGPMIERVEKPNTNYELDKLNTNSSNYLNKIFENLKKSNIEVVLILEPIYANKYKYHLNDIVNEFPN